MAQRLECSPSMRGAANAAVPLSPTICRYRKKDILALFQVFLDFNPDKNGQVNGTAVQQRKLSSGKLPMSHVAFIKVLDVDGSGSTTFLQVLERYYPNASAQDLKVMNSWAYPPPKVESLTVLSEGEIAELTAKIATYEQTHGCVGKYDPPIWCPSNARHTSADLTNGQIARARPSLKPASTGTVCGTSDSLSPGPSRDVEPQPKSTTVDLIPSGITWLPFQLDSAQPDVDKLSPSVSRSGSFALSRSGSFALSRSGSFALLRSGSGPLLPTYSQGGAAITGAHQALPEVAALGDERFSPRGESARPQSMAARTSLQQLAAARPLTGGRGASPSSRCGQEPGLPSAVPNVPTDKEFSRSRSMSGNCMLPDSPPPSRRASKQPSNGIRDLASSTHRLSLAEYTQATASCPTPRPGRLSLLSGLGNSEVLPSPSDAKTPSPSYASSALFRLHKVQKGVDDGLKYARFTITSFTGRPGSPSSLASPVKMPNARSSSGWSVSHDMLKRSNSGPVSQME